MPNVGGVFVPKDPLFEAMHPRDKSGRDRGQFIDVPGVMGGLGGIWDAARGAWMVPKDRKADLHKAGKDMGFEMMSVPDGMRPLRSRGAMASATDPATGLPDPKIAEDAALEKKYGIPPGYSDVMVSDDPTVEVLAIGRDEKGRRQTVRNKDPRFKAGKDAKKYARIAALHKRIDGVDHQLTENAHGDDTAAAMMVVRKMGLRPGSTKNTGADQYAYGASTLQRRHVRIEGDTVHLEFDSKKNGHTVVHREDAELASVLRVRLAGKAGDDEIFPKTNERKMNAWVTDNAGDEFTVKDFRTYLATSTAAALVQDMPEPMTAKEHRQQQLKVGDQVSQILGNTRSESLKSYIDPAVFGPVPGEVDASRRSIPQGLPDDVLGFGLELSGKTKGTLGAEVYYDGRKIGRLREGSAVRDPRARGEPGGGKGKRGPKAWIVDVQLSDGRHVHQEWSSEERAKEELEKLAKSDVPEAPEPPPISAGEVPGQTGRDMLKAAFEGGFTEHEELTGAVGSDSVKRVTLSDGTVGVLKKPKPDQVRRDVLSGTIANALGFDGVHTIDAGEGRLLTNMVPGRPGGKKTPDETLMSHVNDPGAREMGLLDWLVRNRDRHGGNWMVTPDGVVPIDHGLTNFGVEGHERDIPRGVFAKHWLGLTQKPTAYAGAGKSVQDALTVRNPKAKLEPKFSKQYLDDVWPSVEQARADFTDDEWNGLKARFDYLRAAAPDSIPGEEPFRAKLPDAATEMSGVSPEVEDGTRVHYEDVHGKLATGIVTVEHNYTSVHGVKYIGVKPDDGSAKWLQISPENLSIAGGGEAPKPKAEVPTVQLESFMGDKTNTWEKHDGKWYVRKDDGTLGTSPAVSAVAKQLEAKLKGDQPTPTPTPAPPKPSGTVPPLSAGVPNPGDIATFKGKQVEVVRMSSDGTKVRIKVGNKEQWTALANLEGVVPGTAPGPPPEGESAPGYRMSLPNTMTVSGKIEQTYALADKALTEAGVNLSGAFTRPHTRVGSSAGGNYGTFHPSTGEVNVKPTSPRKTVTMLHELGHKFDWEVNGAEGVYGSEGKISAMGKNWDAHAKMREAIAERESEGWEYVGMRGAWPTLRKDGEEVSLNWAGDPMTTQRAHRGGETDLPPLQEGAQLPKVPYPDFMETAGQTEAVRSLQRHPDSGRRYVEYLLRPREIFARAFAQYVVSQSTDPGAVAEWKREQGMSGTPESYYRQQWDDSDFAVLREYFDGLMDHVGVKVKDVVTA